LPKSNQFYPKESLLEHVAATASPRFYGTVCADCGQGRRHKNFQGWPIESPSNSTKIRSLSNRSDLGGALGTYASTPLKGGLHQMPRVKRETFHFFWRNTHFWKKCLLFKKIL